MELAGYYKTNFVLKKRLGYEFDEFDNMVPFEKEIYLALLAQSMEQDRQEKTGI